MNTSVLLHKLFAKWCKMDKTTNAADQGCPSCLIVLGKSLNLLGYVENLCQT